MSKNTMFTVSLALVSGLVLNACGSPETATPEPVAVVAPVVVEVPTAPAQEPAPEVAPEAAPEPAAEVAAVDPNAPPAATPEAAVMPEPAAAPAN